MKKLSYLLLFFSIAVVSAIALIIKPENIDSDYFLLAVAWLIFLIVINWLISVFFFTDIKGENTTQFGILPSLHAVTFLYTCFSIGTLIYFWRLVDYGILPVLHWLLQTIGFGIYGFIFLLSLISAKTAQLPALPAGVTSKDELLQKIKFLLLSSEGCDAEVLNSLRMLDSAIKHSIPHLSVIKNIDRYSELANKINSINPGDLENVEISSEIKSMLVLAKSC